MTSLTVTSTALLDGLQDVHNSKVWQEFFDRYFPLLVSFSRRIGLAESEAQDAAQEALIAFASGYREGNYVRSKGRLRSWLYSIARHKAIDIQRRRREVVVADGVSGETAFLNKIPDEATLSEMWEEEWRRAVLTACMEEVRQQVEPKTMRAFELFVLEGWPSEKVAEHLGLSRDAVFQYKARVLSRMRQVREHMEEVW